MFASPPMLDKEIPVKRLSLIDLTSWFPLCLEQGKGAAGQPLFHEYAGFKSLVAYALFGL